MDIFESDLYRLNRQYLSLCGLWPFHESQTDQFVKKCIFNVCLTTMLILQFLKFFTSPCTMDSIINILTDFLTTIFITITHLTYIINIEGVKTLLKEINYDWNTITAKTERDILRKYAEESKMFTLLFITICNMLIFGTTFFSTVPIIMDVIVPLNETRKRELPVQMEYFLDPDVYFPEILLLTCVFMTIQSAAAISIWTTYFMILQHICGMFRLTSHAMDHAFDLNRNESYANNSRTRWIRCIKLHGRTIKLLDLLKAILEYFIFTDVVIAVIMTGIDFIRISKTDLVIHNFMTSVMNIAFFIGHMFLIFLTCYVGQRLLDHSSDIFEKAYGTTWYDASREVQQSIVLVIMRSMKPSYLSAGKIFIYSYELFAGITRLSMSYATVFYSIQ